MFWEIHAKIAKFSSRTSILSKTMPQSYNPLKVENRQQNVFYSEYSILASTDINTEK